VFSFALLLKLLRVLFVTLICMLCTLRMQSHDNPICNSVSTAALRTYTVHVSGSARACRKALLRFARLRYACVTNCAASVLPSSCVASSLDGDGGGGGRIGGGSGSGSGGGGGRQQTLSSKSKRRRDVIVDVDVDGDGDVDALPDVLETWRSIVAEVRKLQH
jgi:uncharacterized membrane protein YgcG